MAAFSPFNSYSSKKILDGRHRLPFVVGVAVVVCGGGAAGPAVVVFVVVVVAAAAVAASLASRKLCSDGRCTCNLANVSCTDFCGCGKFCENTDTTFPVNVMDDEIDGMVDNNI